MSFYNLLRAAAENADSKGGGVFTEDPTGVENIIWQTRTKPLSDWESALADALMAVFGEGHWDLADCVANLNSRGSRDPAGLPWTAARFEEELAELAKPADLTVKAI